MDIVKRSQPVLLAWVATWCVMLQADASRDGEQIDTAMTVVWDYMACWCSNNLADGHTRCL